MPEGVASFVQLSHRVGYTALKTDQYMEDFFTKHSFSEERALLAPVLRLYTQLTEEFLALMGSPQRGDARRTATIMVANEGVMDLLLNFVCSAEGAGIDLRDVMVFVGREESVTLVRAMGVQAMYSPALGSMPAQAAGGYLDSTFARMMWFKVTPPASPLRCPLR